MPIKGTHQFKLIGKLLLTDYENEWKPVSGL